MNKSVNAVCTKVKNLLSKSRVAHSTTIYSVGVELTFVSEQRGALRFIAQKLHYSQSALRLYMRVAQTWTPKTFSNYANAVNSVGMPLTASHFVTLSGVKDDKKREAFRKQCLAESLSTVELHNLVYGGNKGLSDDSKKRLARLAKSDPKFVNVLYDCLLERATLGEILSYLSEQGSHK